jgi:hypothetical protein
MGWWRRGDWRDRPLNILWFALAVASMYSLSRIIGAYEFMPMPWDVSLVTKVVVWRWVVPIVLVSSGVWFLMYKIRKIKAENGEVIIEPPRQSQQQFYGHHGPEWGQ